MITDEFEGEDALPFNTGAIPGLITSPVGEEDITRWLAGAKSGARMIYFVGNLMEARYYSREVDLLAEFVWALQRQTRVQLFQIRVNEDEKLYLVQKLGIMAQTPQAQP